MSFVAFTERAIDILKSVLRNPSQDEEIPVVSLSPDEASAETREDAIARTRKAIQDAPDDETRDLAQARLEQLEKGAPAGGAGAWSAARKRAKAERPKIDRLTVRRNFKLVFLTVTAITVACGVTYVLLALFLTDFTPARTSAFEAIGFVWKAGVGAIFGLLGGKAT